MTPTLLRKMLTGLEKGGYIKSFTAINVRRLLSPDCLRPWQSKRLLLSMRLSSRLYYWWSAQGKSQDLICQAPTVPLYHAYTYEPDPLLIGGFFYNPQTKSLDTDLIQRLQTVCLGYVRSRVRLSIK